METGAGSEKSPTRTRSSLIGLDRSSKEVPDELNAVGLWDKFENQGCKRNSLYTVRNGQSSGERSSISVQLFSTSSYREAQRPEAIHGECRLVSVAVKSERRERAIHSLRGEGAENRRASSKPCMLLCGEILSPRFCFHIHRAATEHEGMKL